MQDDLLIPGLTEYIQSISPKREEIFLEIEALAEKDDFPIVGPLVGHFLMHYAFLLKPKRIIELGSGYGYSALWFAKAVGKSTEIICTDVSKENSKKARQYFERMGVSNNIKFHIGDALEILDQVDGKFDIIFNDIDKEDYQKAFTKSVPRLKTNGVLVSDNTLWYGRVVESKAKTGATRGVQKYNSLAFNDPRVHSVIIPIRDGLTVSIKL